MAKISIKKLNSEIKEFDKKYDSLQFGSSEERNAYISDAEEILAKFPDPEGKPRKILGEFC